MSIRIPCFLTRCIIAKSFSQNHGGSPLYSDFHDFTLSRRIGRLTLESRLKKACSIQPGTEPGFKSANLICANFVISILCWSEFTTISWSGFSYSSLEQCKVLVLNINDRDRCRGHFATSSRRKKNKDFLGSEQGCYYYFRNGAKAATIIHG
jgi:hypothetical protein